MLKILQCIGLNWKSLDWFTNYLADCFQVVSILGQNSLLKRIDFGVFQGSTLGPFLFPIYINNLGRVNFENGQIFLYADYTALLFEGDNWEETFNNAELGPLILHISYSYSIYFITLFHEGQTMILTRNSDCILVCYEWMCKV